MNLDSLSASDRIRLFQFVCTFAWTDLKVTQAERDFVQRLIGYLRLGEEDRKRVEGWLEVPPRVEDIDPTAVPFEHRQLFLSAATAMVEADGRVVGAEDDALQIFRSLLDECD